MIKKDILQNYKKIFQIASENAKKKLEEFPVRIYIGNATCENAAGSQEVMAEFKKLIAENKMQNVYIGQTGCTGRCDKEPIVRILMEGVLPAKYHSITPEKAKKLFEQHIINKTLVEEWML